MAVTPKSKEKIVHLSKMFGEIYFQSPKMMLQLPMKNDFESILEIHLKMYEYNNLSLFEIKFVLKSQHLFFLEDK